jgi:hypothetical protein
MKPVAKDSPEMAMIAQLAGTTDPRPVHPRWNVVLTTMRSAVDGVPPHVLLWSLLTAAICAMYLGRGRLPSRN